MGSSHCFDANVSLHDCSRDCCLRWVQSKAKDGLGAMKVSSGKFPLGDEEAGKGLQTSQDAKFYAISAKTKEFSNEGKTLVVQFSVKHEQDIDCGGAYLKLGAFDQAKFEGSSEYNIMFGPDICGSATKKTHVIFNYKGKNLDKKKEVRAESDTLTHLYTLIVNSDNTYEVQIDQKKVESGNLADDWDFLLPKKIKDPEQSKPADWVDEKKIPDPEEKKPEGYDDIPKQIPDKDAEKPDDWDDEDDGEWEPPMVDNPEYKGEWKPTMIDNPDYKGEWEHPMIDNPDFVDDKDMYKVCDPCDTVGFELWQVKAGTIFDDIVVTDDVDEAKAVGDKTMEKMTKEKEMHDAEEKKKRDEEDKKREEREAKKKEEDEKAAKEDEEEDDDDDEDDEEEEKPKEEL